MDYRSEAGKQAAGRAKELLIRAATSHGHIPANEIIEAVDKIIEAAMIEMAQRAKLKS